MMREPIWRLRKAPANTIRLGKPIAIYKKKDNKA